MNAKKHSAAFIGSKYLCYPRQLSLLPVSNSAAWMCVDKQTIFHPQMHGITWQMWVIFLCVINIKIASNDSALLPAKHRNLKQLQFSSNCLQVLNFTNRIHLVNSIFVSYTLPNIEVVLLKSSIFLLHRFSVTEIIASFILALF